MKIIWNHQVSSLLKEINLLWMEIMPCDVLISLFLKCRLILQQYLNMGKIKLKRKLVNWLIIVQVFKYVAEVLTWKNSNPEHRSLEFRKKTWHWIGWCRDLFWWSFSWWKVIWYICWCDMSNGTTAVAKHELHWMAQFLKVSYGICIQWYLYISVGFRKHR